MKVREIMETDLITVRPDMSIREVAALMYEHELSALPVVGKDGKIVGIVSESDLIHRLARPHLPPHIELLGGIIYFENPFEMKKDLDRLTAVCVSQIMTEDVTTVSPDAEVEDAATIMLENDFNGLPVVEDEKIIGIVTRHDLLLALASGKAQTLEDNKNC